MQEISFSIPVSGTIRIGDDNSVTITVNRAETSVFLKPPPEKASPHPLPKGTTIFDVLRDSARHFVESTGRRTFSAAELYGEAVSVYPGLKRNSWAAHVIASAPNHPSYKHHGSKRNFFRYMGKGTYRLTPEYLDDSE